MLRMLVLCSVVILGSGGARVLICILGGANYCNTERGADADVDASSNNNQKCNEYSSTSRDMLARTPTLIRVNVSTGSV